MFCSNCGALMDDDAKFCPVCAFKNVEFNDEPPVVNTGNGVVAPDKPQKNAKPKKKYKKVIGLIIFFLIFGGLITGSVFFVLSDFHKVIVAENCVIAGDYDKALRYLHTAESDSADVLEKYIDVENAKEDFIFSAETSKLSIAMKDLDEFCKKVKMLKHADIELLPDELLAKANCYCSAVDYIEDSFEEDYVGNVDLVDGLQLAQMVMLNEVIRNNSSENGNHFTLWDMKWNMDASEEGLEILEDYDFTYIDIASRAVKDNCYLVKSEDGKTKNKVQLGSKTTSVITTMIDYCKNTLSAYETYMETSLEKHDLYEDLYMTNPDRSYKSSVGSSLAKIGDEDDIVDNSETILNMMKRDVLFYLISGKTPN